MVDSIREKIIDNIKTSLEAITIANGYQADISNVQRWEQAGNDRKNTPCIVIVPGDETKDPGPDPDVTCHLPIDIEVWLRHDPRVYDFSTDELINRFLADVEKALMASNGHLRGGNAVTTTLLGNESFITAQGQAFVVLVVIIEILYQHNYDDPYN